MGGSGKTQDSFCDCSSKCHNELLCTSIYVAVCIYESMSFNPWFNGRSLNSSQIVIKNMYTILSFLIFYLFILCISICTCVYFWTKNSSIIFIYLVYNFYGRFESTPCFFSVQSVCRIKKSHHVPFWVIMPITCVNLMIAHTMFFCILLISTSLFLKYSIYYFYSFPCAWGSSLFNFQNLMWDFVNWSHKHFIAPFYHFHHTIIYCRRFLF